MSQFDMASKRAKRLLHKNWTSVVAEAHRLGGLELPGFYIRVEENQIILSVLLSEGEKLRRTGVTIYPDGTVQGDDGVTVVDVLRLALEEAQRRASRIGKISGEMTKLGDPVA